MIRTFGKIAFSSLLILSTSNFALAQKKNIPKSGRVKPQAVEKITTERATTESGKGVILKSNGTWGYVPESQQSVPPQPQPRNIECNLTLAQAPDIRGLRLGMTRAEVQNAFGLQRESDSPFYTFGPTILPTEIYQYRFYSSTLEKLPKFNNVDKLNLEFFGGYVHLLGIKYSPSAAHFNLEEFKSKLSESFNLPIEAWSNDSMQCRDFKISVSPGEFGDYLELTNLITSEEIKQSEKRKRDAFKP
ncbi:MAG TPA: hypothetical protein VGO50_00055 [Pyrinomonadaceae bacterium]|nr:hypothetical protein [Pyrinomonadaceae bacterium]